MDVVQLALQNSLTIQLAQSQREAAKYLNVAYMHLKDFPEIAKEVRLTAHDARTQHRLAAGLMTKFSATGSLIVKRIIPIIVKGVKLKKRKLIESCYDKIIKFAGEMKEETESTRKRYNDICRSVQSSIGDIEIKNKDVKKEREEQTLQKQLEKDRIKETEKEEKNLEKEAKDCADEIKKLEEEKHAHRKKTAEMVQAIAPTDEQRTARHPLHVLNPSGLTGKIGAAINVAGAVVNIVSDVFQHVKKGRQLSAMNSEYAKLERENAKLVELKMKLRKEASEKKDLKLQQLHNIRKLTLDMEAGVCNAENLQQAFKCLGKVDRILNELENFWDKMSAVVVFLRDNNEVDKVYLDELEDEDIAEIFIKDVEESEKYWIMFGQLCAGYIGETESEIPELYKFLESPLDSIDAKERRHQTKMILDSVEKEIKDMVKDDQDVSQ